MNTVATHETRSKRVGRFIVRDWGNGWAADEPNPRLQAIFAQCIPIKADYSLMNQGFEYIAFSAQFDLVEHGTWNNGIPEYEWFTEPDGKGGFKAQAKRIPQ